MYIFKNAIISITRTKGRSILIGIILVVIAVSSCVALSIKGAAKEVVTNYKESNGISATISMNRQNLQKDFKEKKSGSEDTKPTDFMANIPTISVNDIENYANSENISNYYYTAQTNLNSSSLTKVTSEESTSQRGGNMSGGIGQNNKNSGDFTLIGYSSLDAMSQFIAGTYKISSGSMFDISSSENQCIVSDELAEANNLTIGSEVVLTNPNDSSKSYTLKVVGIYNDSSSNTEEKFSMFSMAANQILVPYNILKTTLEQVQSDDATTLSTQVSPTFILKSADVVDSFKQELTTKGLSEYYALETNIDSVNESIKPIENLNSFATVFLILVLIIGGIILVVLNMINIRERKYEIGVLRAIGMKKHLVLAQFMSELLMVTMLSVILGGIIGSVISVPTANYMLKNEISSIQSSQEKVNENFGGNFQSQRSGGQTGGQRQGGMMNALSGNTDKNYISQINAVIDIKVILELALLGLGLTVVSSSISTIFIARYTPLKILSSRT